MQLDTQTCKNLLHQQGQIAYQINATINRSLIQSLEERLTVDDFRVLIVGEFNRGKSTLMNVLAGQEVFDTSVIQVPTINILRYGETPSAVVLQQKSDEPMSCTLNDLAAVDTSTAYQVEVSLPLDWLKDNVTITEYPTMSEHLAGDQERTRFLEQVRRADLIVVVLACDILYPRSEKDRVEQDIRAAGHEEILFACNAYDRLQEKEREGLRKNAYARLPAPQERIFFTTAISPEDEDVVRLQTLLASWSPEERQRLKIERVERVLQATLTTLREQMKQKEQEQDRQEKEVGQEVSRLTDMLNQAVTMQLNLEQELVSFQKSTVELVRGKTKTFVADLSADVQEWAKENPSEQHLNTRLQQAVRQWHQNDLIPYLRLRVNTQQEQLLETSVGQLEEQLQTIYEAIGNPQPVKITFQISGNGIDSPRMQRLHGSSTSSTPQNEFLLLDLPRIMPEVLLFGGGSAILLFFNRLVGFAGFAATGIYAYRQFNKIRNSSHHQEQQRSSAEYVQQVDAQQEQIVQQVIEELERNIRSMHTSMTSSLEKAIRNVRQASDSYVEQKRDATATKQRTGLPEIEATLNTIEQQLVGKTTNSS